MHITALSFLLTALGGTLGNSLAWTLVEGVPRRHLLAICLTLTSVCAMILSAMPIGLSFSLIAGLEASRSAAGTILYTYTPEVMPTSIRGTVFGLCGALFRLGMMLGPPLALLLDHIPMLFSGTLCAIMYGGAAIVSMQSQTETLNQPIIETMKIYERKEQSQRKLPPTPA